MENKAGEHFPDLRQFSVYQKANAEMPIGERFEAMVGRYGDRVAVKLGDRALTYDDLNRAANRIGRTILARRGEGSEAIALLFEEGIDAIAALLGICKAGKFYVPLDPAFPAARNAFIFDEAQALLIVTNTRQIKLAEQLTRDPSRLLNVDDVALETDAGNLRVPVSMDDLFAVVFTSGSTGDPKGVPLSHRLRFNDTLIHSFAVSIRPEDRLSLLQPAGAVAAEIQLFRSLLNGAGLFLYSLRSEGIHLLANWLHRERISVLHTSPAVFRQLSDSLPVRGTLGDLRIVQLSGAPISVTDFDAYKAKFSSPCRLVLHMGSTEAGAICAAVVDESYAFPAAGAPVGYPYPTKAVVLLDDERRPVDTGDVGEIGVRSRYLAEGYWHSPESTAAKFIDASLGGGERIYLTGDLGRVRPDGFLLHLGRKDFMVKIHGNRVELGEIEKALLAYPQVRDAAAMAWDHESGEKYLAAYAVPKAGAQLAIADLRLSLAEKLPSYMMPSAIMILESLPLTYGKLDRNSLPKPDDRRPELHEPYVAARTETEKRLVNIWEETLEIRPIGVRDDYFELGGDSLMATRIISRVAKEFPLAMSLRAFLQAANVEAMAALIAESRGGRPGE